jgi:hypothetical protein
MEVLALTDSGVAATAVKAEGAQVICRVYATSEKTVVVEAGVQCLQPADLRSLAGERITHLNPYQIGELLLGPRSKT